MEESLQMISDELYRPRAAENKLVITNTEKLRGKIIEKNHSKLPLFGRTVLVTRTADGNIIERAKLEALGAKVVELASIQISPPSSWDRVDAAISRMQEFDWIIFTSANGVKLFFERCSQKGMQEFLSELRGTKEKIDYAEVKPKFACVGSSTKRALELLGFKSSFEPSVFQTSSLAKEFVESVDVKGMNILLARAERANGEVAAIIKGAGAKVTETPVYKTNFTQMQSEYENRRSVLSSKVLQSLTDITLTSPSTVEGLLNFIGAEEIRSRSIRIHCIGPVTARAVQEKGLPVNKVSRTHTIDGLIASIIDTQNGEERENED